MSSVKLRKADGNLGLVTAVASVPLLIGPGSNAAAINTMQIVSQIKNVPGLAGYGPVQEATEHMLKKAGGSAMVMVASASIPGTVLSSSVYSSHGNMTVTGTPYAYQDFIAEFTTPGALGVARLKFSLDGKTTSYTEDFTSSTSIALQHTGLTLNLSASSPYAAGDTLRFTAYAPSMSSSDVQQCYDVFKASGFEPSQIVICNDTFSASLAAALHPTCDGMLSELDNDTYNIFTELVLPKGGVPRDYVVTNAAFASLANSSGNGLALVAERCRYVAASNIPGRSSPQLPYAYDVAALQQSVAISTPIDRVNNGPSSNVSEPTWDERLDGRVYEAAKTVAPTTFPGTGGVYVNKSLLFSGFNSDYKFMEWSRVINRAAKVTVNGLFRFLNDIFRTTDTGTMLPEDITRVESYVNGQLSAALEKPLNVNGFAGHVSLNAAKTANSGVRMSLDPGSNILVTSTQSFTVLVKPMSKVTEYDGEISFAVVIPDPAAGAPTV